MSSTPDTSISSAESLESLPSSVPSNIEPPRPTQLIVVCCHAIWNGPTLEEKDWLIQPFQQGETECFIRHIEAGFRLLKELGGKGILMFSGGPTRPEIPLSEAKSYLNLAQELDYFGIFGNDERQFYGSLLFGEQRALDSFQNIFFSLLEFNRIYQRFPESMMVVSHEFKRARFEELHFKAVKECMIPTTKGFCVKWQGKTYFKGIDPEHMVMSPDCERARSIRVAERKNGYEPWEKDPTGVLEELAGKRIMRNAWNIDMLVDVPVLTEGVELDVAA